MTTSTLSTRSIRSIPQVQRLPWNSREKLILIGNLELFAFLLSRCYLEMAPDAQDSALKLAKVLSHLRQTLELT